MPIYDSGYVNEGADNIQQTHFRKISCNSLAEIGFIDMSEQKERRRGKKERHRNSSKHVGNKHICYFIFF